MKALILIVFLSSALGVFGESMPDSLGFTDKAQAKNQMVNGLKEGKWMECEAYRLDSDIRDSTKDAILYMGLMGIHLVPFDSNEATYNLTIYKAGKVLGISRSYYKSGKLYSEHRYSDGKLNGVARIYYESGKLMRIIPFTNGIRVGVEKDYYVDGKLHSETIDNPDGTFQETKYYKENGRRFK